MDRSDARLFFKFLNSHHADDVADWFASPALFERWLSTEQVAESGLLLIDAADVELAREARDALNALVDDRSPRHARQLDAVAQRLPLRTRFDIDGSRLEAVSTGVQGLTARVVGIAHDAMRDGTWDRLSRCNNDDCEWTFLDRSKNHSKRWCDMKSCGTQAKSRAYRARQRELRERTRSTRSD